MGEQERQQRIEPSDGGPDKVQLVTPEGERVSHPEYDAIADEVTTQELQGFYRDMVIVRRCDNEATALQRKGIESKYLYFPDENHWVLKPQNSVQWHDEVLGWLDRWTATPAR